MGTRADAYVGRGPNAEWLGSIAWDGDDPGADVIAATTEDDYRAAVETLLAERDDATRPEQGWPWPWENSQLTDYAWAFDNGKVYFSVFGNPWVQASSAYEDRDEMDGPKVEFPDMTNIQAVTFGPRSGVIILGGTPPPDEASPS